MLSENGKYSLIITLLPVASDRFRLLPVMWESSERIGFKSLSDSISVLGILAYHLINIMHPALRAFFAVLQPLIMYSPLKQVGVKGLIGGLTEPVRGSKYSDVRRDFRR